MAVVSAVAEVAAAGMAVEAVAMAAAVAATTTAIAAVVVAAAATAGKPPASAVHTFLYSAFGVCALGLLAPVTFCHAVLQLVPRFPLFCTRSFIEHFMAFYIF